MSAGLGCRQPLAAEALGQRCQEPTFYGKLPVQMTNEGTERGAGIDEACSMAFEWKFPG